jgi:hypothetical protein
MLANVQSSTARATRRGAAEPEGRDPAAFPGFDAALDEDDELDDLGADLDDEDDFDDDDLDDDDDDDLDDDLIDLDDEYDDVGEDDRPMPGPGRNDD